MTPDRIVTCVYCGKEYPNNTPTHGTEILTSHIEECEQHPLYAARKEIDFLHEIIDKLIKQNKIESVTYKKMCHYFDREYNLRSQINLIRDLTKD